MKCCFLIIFWLYASFVSTASDNGESRALGVILQARSQQKLIVRTATETSSPRSPKSPRNGHAWSSERRLGNSPRQRSSTPIPDRNQMLDLERPSSPGPRQRPPLPRTPPRKSLGPPGRIVSSVVDGPVSPWSGSGSPGRRFGQITSGSGNSPSTPPRRTALRTPVEAHALVSGTGSVWASSPHKYGGLTSQTSISDTYKPSMKSAKDLDRAKAGSVTRSRTSKATASATGPQVTAKLSRDANGSEIGSGSIEFRAGKSFTQIHKIGLGEKIERTLTASDILDGKNRPFHEVTVSTHLRGAGSCSVSACYGDSVESPPRSDDGKNIGPLHRDWVEKNI